MGTYKNFEDLDVWKSSRILVKSIYNDFNKCKDFSFRDQITRAVISVMNNIAEGFCRGTDSQFSYFLDISKGSAGEIKNLYYVAEDLKYIEPSVASLRRDDCQKILNSLGGFIKYLKK